ncbi:metallophosphoesterase [Luteococcus sp.]|uniref:metallophosphoesterase n=1 Tax=Luteococcus sp. TaxID=1969402 RepID=UPI003735F871
MGSIFLTSDLHLGHLKAATMRGFSNVESHDGAILRNIAKVTTDGSTLWILGDVAFGAPEKKLDSLAKLREAANGRLRLILGNHDKPHPANASNPDMAPWRAVFETIDTRGRIRHAGVQYRLSHFPISGDNDHSDEGERFEMWRERDGFNSCPIIHGHTHGRERLTWSDGGTPQIHVGLDAWQLKPVPMWAVHQTASGNAAL